MINGGKSGEFREKAFEKSWWERLYGCGDRGLVRENNILSNLRVGGKETPVDIGTITDIRVVVLCCGILEDLLDECLSLGVLWLLQEEFNNCCENLELCLVVQYKYLCMHLC